MQKKTWNCVRLHNSRGIIELILLYHTATPVPEECVSLLNIASQFCCTLGALHSSTVL